MAEKQQRLHLAWLKMADQHEMMANNCERAKLPGIAKMHRELAGECREKAGAFRAALNKGD